MAKVKCKGTVLNQTIATVLTAIAQVISLDGPGMESETYEADTLDNSDAGIPYKPTGRSEGGSLGFDVFFDPALAGHLNLLDLLTRPATETWQIIFADSGTSEWDFDSAGLSFSPTVALGDGLKASCSLKLDGLPSFPAGGSAV